MSSDGSAGAPRRPSKRVRRRRFLAVLIAILVVIGGTAAAITAIALTRTTDASAAPSPTPTATPVPTPTPTPLTPSEQLLASTQDPNACAVSFEGDGISDAPQLQTQGALYSALPIPSRDGSVFAGWYATPADAASFNIPARINGSELVACTQQQITLYGSWKTPEENAAENARIPIMMYHQFTANPAGESGWLRGNYAYIGDFDAHMNHIATGGFYLPTWDELSAFIDARLWLPNHSVIITDDDADQSWFDLAAPVVDRYKLLATSFMITAYRQDPPPNPYVLRRSHTHDMHKAGANGEGEMVNLTAEQIAADMETSAQVLGVKEVMAYPYGHYNETSKEGLRLAGFEMARTIEPGYVTIGTDKLALPVQRINYGMGVDAVARLIG
ncbi:polysaccharide deacetylase family protein [Microbacterium sp. 4R-513]|uniref:polysaccharide deacetylase family protein n=1 Tax=Microbacterium sp. 4R-513 TaxID=2567934 RepID=UPI0013E14D8F|nr:polysaccharide deacetylase family protein [Microbacterium sp. 4R-513]QIG38793.1 polysaccharide deacetylase family protein [Microbacterium sp. 4R-513]